MNLKSQKPRIGIRPVIDGRRGGIRESLEQTTMDMAQRVAELYAGSCAIRTARPSNASSPTAVSAV